MLAPVMVLGTTQAASRPKALYIGGADYLIQGGTASGRFGVLLDSIEVEAAPAGGVSSMTFIIDDPSKVVTLNAGDPVRFVDNTNDRPIFLGFLQAWTIEVVGLGRSWTVTCVGVEIVLDWITVPAMTLAGNSTMTGADAMQNAVGAMYGIGFDLRALAGASTDGQAAQPIGGIVNGAVLQPNDVTVPAGSTLREALRLLGNGVADYAGGGAYTSKSNVQTVDFWGGLRVCRPNPTSAGSGGEFAALTVTDTPAGPDWAEGLSHTVDSSTIVRNVLVTGGNAAGSGLVSDGSGIPGATTSLSDSSLTTQAARNAAAFAMMVDLAQQTRGEFTMSDYTTSAVKPMSSLVLTDAETGATGTYVIGTITKSFHATREYWRISYGGMPPSMTRAVRRLTRSTLN